jgi:hypothetical protein
MTEQTIRLHLTPFSKDLLSAILPPSSAACAKNISFHTLQTFPESCYGYVDLPAMEAEKVKKKLSGAILRGKKIHVEEARIRKRRREDSEQEGSEPVAAEPERLPQRPKRSKKDPATLEGHELSPERKVKRGWTEPKPKKDRSKKSSEQAASKYTDKAEALFRAKVPANKKELVKKDHRENKKKSQNVLVHEFEKSTIQPSFLRDESSRDAKPATEYVDGKGWVNGDGEVVESERVAEPAKTKPGTSKKNVDRMAKQKPLSNGAAKSSQEHAQQRTHVEDDEDATSPSGESDASTTESNISSQTTPKASAIHPLKALFKRPSAAASASQEKDVPKPSLELQTLFTFFDPGDADDDIDETMTALNNKTIPPDTPYTSQDTRTRALRSAAPTPDTAAPSRFTSRSHDVGQPSSSSSPDPVRGEMPRRADNHGLGISSVESQTPSKDQPNQSVDKNGKTESEFASWFYAHRSENFRLFKQRRREAMKEARQRENRRSSRRGRL